MKINKKQIVFLSLALVVCIAVYLNWRYLDHIDLGQENLIAVDGDSTAKGDSEGKKLGQAELVETVAKDVDTYFAECKLEKQQNRDEALQLLKTVAESEESASEAKDKANNDMIAMARATDVEGTIESLVKAKGFEKCVAVVNGDTASVIVSCDTLTPGETAQISEIVYEAAGIVPANLKIIEKN